MKLVYFVQDSRSGEIKIATSRRRRLDRELQRLQRGNPAELKLLGVIPARNARTLVRELHASFSASRLRSDWYKPAPNLETYIRSRAVMP